MCKNDTSSQEPGLRKAGWDTTLKYDVVLVAGLGTLWNEVGYNDTITRPSSRRRKREGNAMCKNDSSSQGPRVGIEGWDTTLKYDAVLVAGLDGARQLGVEPMMTAAELSDPNVDHLAIMAFLSKFVHVTPPTPNPEKLTLNCSLQDVKLGNEVSMMDMDHLGGGEPNF